MKTGDKVRYLNAVGGGIVKRFKNKDIVWVEEDDGFETPALIRECISILRSNRVLCVFVLFLGVLIFPTLREYG